MEVVEKEEGLAKWRGRSQGSLRGGPGLDSKAPLGRCEGRTLQAEDKKSFPSSLYLGEMSLDLKKVQERYLPVSGVVLSPQRLNIQTELKQAKSKSRAFKSSPSPFFLCAPTTALGIWALA